MKRYDSYKPSGVEWIGEIPSHWSVNRLKFEIGLHGRIGWNGLRSDEFQVVSHAYLVTGQDFEGSDIPWDKCYQIDKERYEEDPFIQLKEGDILVTKDGSIGKVAMVRNLDKPACLNSGIFVLKQKHNAFNQLYLYWLLNSDIFKGFISYHQSGSTILHLYQNVFDNMPTVVPPMKEQIIMADYLDKKCGEIDKSIATRQRRIELLEELKQSVITQAVTRGLDPNVPLRDSGIEWIGQIPEHWKCIKLKFICIDDAYNIKTGPFGSQLKGQDLLDDGPIPVYSQRNVIDSDFEETKYFVTEDKASQLSSFFTKPNDLLITSRGTIGRAAILPIENRMGILHPCLIAIRLNPRKVNHKFVLYCINEFNGFKINVQLESNATTIEVIYTNTLKNIFLPVPPLPEQQAIADYLDRRCAEIDSMIEREKKKIELMQELKQSIITEVVTGKRKVV